mgnify:CR=1 FL=1
MPHTYLHDIDPIALGLPFWPHGIHWYGLMYLLGFGVAWWLGNRRVAAGRLMTLADPEAAYEPLPRE